MPVTVVLLAVVAVRIVMMAQAAGADSIGIDYAAVTDGARRWLETGTPFLDRQLHGAYPQTGATLADSGEFLYPPTALPFFLLAAWLPSFLWWLIPSVLAVLALRHLRPDRRAWPIMVLLLGTASGPSLIVSGSPTMWVAVAVLWAPLTGWTAALVLLKPSFLPFALLGVRGRRWWVAVALFSAAAIPFGGLWIDWVEAVADMVGSGVLYSIRHVPFVLAALVAVLASHGVVQLALASVARWGARFHPGMWGLGDANRSPTRGRRSRTLSTPGVREWADEFAVPRDLPSEAGHDRGFWPIVTIKRWMSGLSGSASNRRS